MNKCPVCQSEGFVEQCLQCGWYVQPQWSEDEKQLRLQERIDIWYEDEMTFPTQIKTWKKNMYHRIHHIQ